MQEQEARAAVRHLASLGRRRIAHISGPLDQTSAVDRLDGWRDITGAAGAGLDNAPDLLASGDFTAFVDAIVKAKPAGAKGKYVRKVALSSTMGPGLKVDVAEVATA